MGDLLGEDFALVEKNALCRCLDRLLELDRFWARRLPDSREGTRWRHILQTLVCYRLIDPAPGL